MKKRAFAAIVSMAVLMGIPATSVGAASNTSVQISQQQKEKTVNYGRLLEMKDVNYFLQKANEYRASHPESSLDDINNYLKGEMESYYKDKTSGTVTTEDYPIPVSSDQLNSQEIALYNSNPFYGIQSLACGKTALDESKIRYTNDTLIGGNGDAFRHAYWNAMMVNSTSESWANQWATAHEEGDTNNDFLNKTMDLTNNSRGRQIGVANPTLQRYYPTTLAPIVRQWVDSGKMVRIVNNSLVSTDATGKL